MPDRTHPNEHERSRPPTARRGSPLWLSVREPLARVDSVHLYFTHFTAWKRTPSSVTSASHRRQGPHLQDRPSESGNRQQDCSDPQTAVVVNHQDRPG